LRRNGLFRGIFFPSVNGGIVAEEAGRFPRKYVTVFMESTT